MTDLPRLDRVLAGVMLVVAVGSALARKPPEGPLSLTVPVAVVSAMSLLWRSRAPLFAIALAMGSELTQTAFGHTPSSLWSFAIALVLVYSVAAELSEGLAGLGGATIVVVECLEERIDNGVDYVFIAIVFGGAWLIGRASRQWRGRATHAETHQHELARLAVAEERVRIARELHDVVAHGLSVIAVQADAAEAALGRDPDLLVGPLRAIRTSAREALGEMRQLLNLLRADDVDSAGRSPARGFADLPALIDAMSEAGLPIRSELRFGAGPVDAGIELAGYRIVQESLTNVLKHAGHVATTLRVVGGPQTVEIQIVNEPGAVTISAGSGGRGLLGIRERVKAAGGSVRYGAGPDGGYEVMARLPRELM
jgi:signal transduction histidine kinase